MLVINEGRILNQQPVCKIDFHSFCIMPITFREIFFKPDYSESMQFLYSYLEIGFDIALHEKLGAFFLKTSSQFPSLNGAFLYSQLKKYDIFID